MNTATIRQCSRKFTTDSISPKLQPNLKIMTRKKIKQVEQSEASTKAPTEGLVEAPISTRTRSSGPPQRLPRRQRTTLASAAMSITSQGEETPARPSQTMVNQNIPRPLSFEEFQAMMMSAASNSFQNINTSTPLPFFPPPLFFPPPPFFSPHNEGTTILSPLARPFTSINPNMTLSPFSTPLRPSTISESNSAPTNRTYGTRSSFSPGRNSQSAPSRRRTRDLVTFQTKSLPRPEPTTSYLEQSLRGIEVIKVAKPLLLVIDLNGTILYRPGKIKGSRFVERPFTNSFMTYAFANHKVMIWSSARPHNVSNMCHTLFPGGRRNQLVGEWSREHLGLTEQEYNDKTTVYKRLERVWADSKIQATYPRSKKAARRLNNGGGWDQSNTVLIDDTMEKARGQPFNLVQLPEFISQNVDDDTVLPVLVDYLEILKKQANVSCYIRQTPFDYETLKAKFSDPNYSGDEDAEVSEGEEEDDDEDYVLPREQGKHVLSTEQGVPGSEETKANLESTVGITRRLSQTSLEHPDGNNGLVASSLPYSPRISSSLRISPPPYSPHFSSPPYSPKFHENKDSDSDSDDEDGGAALPLDLP